MNKQTKPAPRRRTMRLDRTLGTPLTIIVTTVLCLASKSHAQISVGAAGSTVEPFNTLPPATSWATFQIAGASGTPEDDAGLDAMVQVVAASSITAQVQSSIGNPPGLAGNAQWSSDGFYLLTRPTVNAATLLVAKLRNTSGSSLTALTIDYDYVQRLSGVVVEAVPGNRVYYSLSGAANSWVPLGNFGDRDPVGVTQPQSILLDLSATPWTANSTMYVLFADDNNGPNPDAANSIDNFRVSPPLPIVITEQPANTTVVENRPVTLSVALTGTAPQYQWFKDSVAITDATNRTYTIANATLSDTGDYTVTITGRLNTVPSNVARLTVVQDLTGPVLLNVKGDDTFTKLFLKWNERILVDAAEEEGSYQILGPNMTQIPVTLATLVDGSNVVLVLGTRLLENTVYSVEAGFQVDLAGNPTVKVGNPAVDPTSGVVTSFRSFVTTRGFTRFQTYLNRPTAETLATFVTLPEYPDNSSFDFYTNILNWAQTAPNVEYYVMRFTGLFVAPETGSHHFDPAHDDEMRLRVYPGEDTSGTPAEMVAACCTGLTGGPTLDVDLVAGQRYYYELLVKEFAGGDYAGIGVTLPSGAASAALGIPGQFLQVASDPGSVLNPVIAQQPQNQTVQINHFGTLAVVVTGAGGGPAYQWQINTGAGFNDVANGNAATYITPLLTLADNGAMYRVLVTVPGRSITSSVVTVSVVNDTVAPHITSVGGGGTAITVFFDEVMEPAAIGEVGNYDLKDSANTALALSSPVIAADNRSVSFTTPAQTLGELYTLHAENVPDAAGNPLVPVDIVFRSGRGFALFEAFDTSSTAGNAVSLLTAHPNFPNSPRDTALITTFDSRAVYPDDSHEQYGGRISGWYIPPATANYTFYLRSDDASELWLSTNNTVAGRVKIQEETGCCNTFSVHPSAPKSLVAGQAYYIEILWKEGTGGDFGQVAVKAATDPTDPNSLTPISGAFLSAADPTLGGGGGTPQITARRNGNNLVITWPGSFTTFVLETAPTIPSVTWTPVSSAVVNGENTATIPIPASGNAFYRLRQ